MIGWARAVHGIGPKAFILLATSFGSSSWVSIQGHSLSIAFFHARSQVFHDKQQQWAGDPTHKCKKEDRAMALQLAGPIATDLAFT